MKRSARMTGFNRIGEVGIPTELRRQNSLGEILVHGRLVPLLPAPSQPLRRTLSTLTIIPATPSVAPPIHSRRNTVSDFDFDTPKKRQPFVAPTPHRSEDINTENEAPKKEYDPVGLGRRTRTKTGDEYTSLQDVSRSHFFAEDRPLILYDCRCSSRLASPIRESSLRSRIFTRPRTPFPPRTLHPLASLAHTPPFIHLTRPTFDIAPTPVTTRRARRTRY